MITLYTFGPAFDLPDSSPFVTKTEVQLKMAGLDYRTDRSGYPTAPKGKLPYIEDDGVVVADSTFIRAHIERKYGFDFDRGLDDVARARAWAIERMLEDHLYWAAAYTRWIMSENFAKGPAHFFDAMPEAEQAAIRRAVVDQTARDLRGQGLGRHSEAEIADLAGRSLSALATLLGDDPYIGGDRPCGADATAFSFTAGVLAPFFDSPVRRAAENFPSLTAYVGRMMRTYYPDNAWMPAAETVNARRVSAHRALAVAEWG